MNFPLGTALFPATPLIAEEKQGDAKSTLRVKLAVGLGLVDLASLVAGFGLAVYLAPHGRGMELAGTLIGAFAVLYFLAATMMRAFSGGSLMSRGKSVGVALASLFVAMGAFLSLVFLLKAGMFTSRIEVAAGVALSALFMALGRFGMTSYAMARLGGSLYSTLVIRDPIGGHASAVSRSTGRGIIDVSGWFDPYTAGPAEYDALARLIGAADRVVLDCAHDRRLQWAHALQGMNVHAEVLAPELSNLGAVGLSQHEGEATLVVARGPLGLRDRLLKRLFDLAFSITILIFLAPLLLVVALAVKFDSPGPVFFRQPRIGRQNRVFYVYKFRSMHTQQGDTGGRTSTRRGDPRITRVGRFIRATSIDELPQFLNVLFGDMSVIGPRPHAIYSTAEELLFWEIDKRYWHRHACKPGITGLAQIMGLRGATERRRDLTDRVSADLDYLNSWSFSRDILILFRTLGVIFHRNAY